MTNEDKQLICEYMGWNIDPYWWCDCSIYGNPVIHKDVRNFDLNDAGLVVAEMQKRGDWITFVSFVDDYHYNADIQVEFTAWLFNADNFFKAFVEWRKTK